MFEHVFDGFCFSKIVLAAIQDEGQRSMTSDAYKALLAIGAKEPMKRDYRGSFALIGFSRNMKPGFVQQVSKLGPKYFCSNQKSNNCRRLISISRDVAIFYFCRTFGCSLPRWNDRVFLNMRFSWTQLCWKIYKTD